MAGLRRGWGLLADISFRARRPFALYFKAKDLRANLICSPPKISPEFINQNNVWPIRGLTNPGFNIPDSHHMRLVDRNAWKDPFF